jgi:hypothetical protein
LLTAVLLVVLTGASIGILKWLRERGAARWFAASLPWWVMARSSGWFEFGAAILTFAGIVAFTVGPTLPGRRRGRASAIATATATEKETPLPQLANGPIVPVTPRVYHTAKPSPLTASLTVMFFILACAMAVASASAAEPLITGALALASLIITVTFAFLNWFSARVRLRIDQHGLHSRVFFDEQTIPWREVAGLTLRYSFLAGIGVRVVYYVVYSPTHEFTFASSIDGAKELQLAIEAATGFTFPEPAMKGRL